jgi:hypothetical protein
MTVLHPGDLVAVAAPLEERQKDGRLANPPKLFVATYEQDIMRLALEPISWAAARALAPEQTRQLAIELTAARQQGIIQQGTLEP